MTKVKFCGLTRAEDIESANELTPDFVGFVFAKKSKRFISPNNAALLRAKLNKSIKTVGVFVDEALENIANIANKDIIDIIQLHGTEDADYIKRLRKSVNNPIIKAIRIKTAEDAANAERFGADYVMFDGGAGDGKTFDWSLLKNVAYPYFLAGGLNLNNVGAAVGELSPFAVDVSSGIETDGVKDMAKMREFLIRARG